jgi:hypothetical protein
MPVIDYAPPGVEHWHGAAPNEPLVQLGVVPFGGGIKFLEPVTDAQYSGQARWSASLASSLWDLAAELAQVARVSCGGRSLWRTRVRSTSSSARQVGGRSVNDRPHPERSVEGRPRA